MMQKHKLSFSAFASFWLLIGSWCPQVHSATYRLTYNPNMFDDQYIGCSDKLEKDIMPEVLQKEKTNKQFKEAWINATNEWEEIKDDLDLPEGFEDEYGVALLIFTNQYPKGNPIYRQLNGNLTIAGASRKDYMEKFHFKALHFYLTRALQMLKPNCNVSYTTYRGSKDSIHVQRVFKFGRFTSASLNYKEAQSFGTESFFKITTCFGAKVADFSFFPSEEEVLIPPTEKFLYLKKQNLVYILQSTGQMCSYFNCAYLGAEKREVAVCRSDTNESEEETKNEMEERLKVLEDQITWIHEYRDDYEVYISEHLTQLYDGLKRMEAQVEGLTELVDPLLKNEKKKIENLLLHHQQELLSLRVDLKRLQDTNESEEETKNKMEERLEDLEDQITWIHEYRDDYEVYINEHLTHLYDDLQKRMEAQVEGLTELVDPLLEKEKKIENLLLHHQQELLSFKVDLKKLQEGLTELKNETLHTILRHNELLASMQETVGILQGIFVSLITLLVIVGFTTICSHFFSWM